MKQLKTYGKRTSFKSKIEDITFNIIKKQSVKTCTKKLNSVYVLGLEVFY